VKDALDILDKIAEAATEDDGEADEEGDVDGSED
jgi:hypothetical protein